MTTDNGYNTSDFIKRSRDGVIQETSAEQQQRLSAPLRYLYTAISLSSYSVTLIALALQRFVPFMDTDEVGKCLSLYIGNCENN